MHLVGSDALEIVDGLSAPAGVRHAVTGERAVCTDGRPRFLWPALAWTSDDAASCRACADAVRPAGLFETPGVASS